MRALPAAGDLPLQSLAPGRVRCHLIMVAACDKARRKTIR